MCNKNAVCKIILTNWKIINKTISYVTVWSTFNWNLLSLFRQKAVTTKEDNNKINKNSCSLINAKPPNIAFNTEIKVGMNRQFNILIFTISQEITYILH